MEIFRIQADGSQSLVKQARQREYVSFRRSRNRQPVYIRKQVGVVTCDRCHENKRGFQYGIQHMGGRVVWEPGNFCCKEHYLAHYHHELVPPSPAPAVF